jgi:hypothetical protein
MKKKQKYIFEVESPDVIGKSEFFTSFTKAKEYVNYLEENFYLVLVDDYHTTTEIFLSRKYEGGSQIKIFRKQLNTFIR